MNRERIKLLRDKLASLPDKKFNLSHWFSGWLYWAPPAETNKQMLEGSCGSSACIAGWALAMFAPDERVPQHAEDFTPRAAELLDLGHDEARALFEPEEDEELDWDSLGYDMTREDITRGQAIQVLDHLLATGEVDWRVAFQ